MTYHSLFVAVLANDGALPQGAVNFALTYAKTHGAHVTFAIGAVRVPSVNMPFGGGYNGLVSEENDKRSAYAHSIAENLRANAESMGVTASCEVMAHLADHLMHAISQRARLFDLLLMGRPRHEDSHTLHLAESLMLETGRPLLLVPDPWSAPSLFNHIVVGWDGSANAARALSAANACLKEAKRLDIVSVSGEKDLTSEMAGTDLAPMLARFGADVSVNALPLQGRSVAQTLCAYANQHQADMLLMGAYAHSRFRQMILGGTTRDMLTTSTLPLFLAH